MYVIIADSSKIIDFDFTEGIIITPSTSDSKTLSVSKFNITSTVTNTTTISHISESQFPTLQPNKHVIPLPKNNCVDTCFEKICTAKNLGKKKCFFFQSNLYLLFLFNF